MDTDDVNSLAEHLNRAANEIINATHDLRRSANRLNSKWHGGRSDQFLRRMSSAVNALEDVAEDATRLSRRVRLEVDEWLEADREGAGRVLGAVAPLPTPAPTPWPNVSDQQGLIDQIAEMLEGGRPGEVPGKIWDWGELGLLFLASGFINISNGSSYGGQVVIKGPQWAKELWGLSPHLTHIKGSSVAGHIGSASRGVGAIALIAPILRTYEQWLVAAQTPHNDNLRAGTAMFVDTLVIFGTYLTLTHVGASIGASVGSWIGGGVAGMIGAAGGTAAAPGPGTVAGGAAGVAGGAAAGAIIGGVAGGIAGNWVAGMIVDEYFKSDLRNQLIDTLVDFLRPPSRPSILPGTQGVLA
jgi:uncharacterized protein YukE